MMVILILYTKNKKNSVLRLQLPFGYVTSNENHCGALQVFDGIIQVLLLQGEAQKATIQNALASFETLDQALGKVSGGLPYFGGENLGFVDLMFAPLVCWSPAIEAAGEFKIPFEDKYPHLHAWLHAFKQSSVSSVLPEPEKVTEFAINVLRKAALSS